MNIFSAIRNGSQKGREDEKELAEKTKISEVTLSRYIHGDRQPRANNIANIANVLQTTTDYLLGGENQNDFK